MEQQTLEFYTAVKTKISNRYCSFFVRDISGKTWFSMWWFAKRGGHVVVNVLLKEAFGIQIEFTRWSRSLGKRGAGPSVGCGVSSC